MITKIICIIILMLLSLTSCDNSSSIKPDDCGAYDYINDYNYPYQGNHIDTRYKYTYDADNDIIYTCGEGCIYSVAGDIITLVYSGAGDMPSVTNVYYYEGCLFMYSYEQSAFYKYDLEDGTMTRVISENDVFPNSVIIGSYFIKDDKIFAVLGYWEGVWSIDINSGNTDYYGEYWGGCSCDEEYIYIKSSEIYKINIKSKVADMLDTSFIKQISGRIYIDKSFITSNDKIYYTVQNEITDEKLLYCGYSDKDGGYHVQLEVKPEMFLFEHHGNIYFCDDKYLYRLSCGDDSVETFMEATGINIAGAFLVGDYVCIQDNGLSVITKLT